ncbi:hypothetical protein NECID01_1818 [Nematocida sp. AWRm77]|nr:hypothetical protein NECID01_1818 [Nematocida sp. AWRm77]
MEENHPVIPERGLIYIREAVKAELSKIDFSTPLNRMYEYHFIIIVITAMLFIGTLISIWYKQLRKKICQKAVPEETYVQMSLIDNISEGETETDISIPSSAPLPKPKRNTYFIIRTFFIISFTMSLLILGYLYYNEKRVIEQREEVYRGSLIDTLLENLNISKYLESPYKNEQEKVSVVD